MHRHKPYTHMQYPNKYAHSCILTQIIHLYTDELPKLDELLILKYTDKGKKHKVRIISEAGHKWKVIASLICDDANRTSVLEQKCPNDPEECLRQTLIENFINKKPKKYTQDWNGLIELLDDVDLETLAERVNSAISVCAR